METIDRDRLARPLDAVGEVDHGPAARQAQGALKRGRGWLAVRALGAVAVLGLGSDGFPRHFVSS